MDTFQAPEHLNHLDSASYLEASPTGKSTPGHSKYHLHRRAFEMSPSLIPEGSSSESRVSCAQCWVQLS